MKGYQVALIAGIFVIFGLAGYALWMYVLPLAITMPQSQQVPTSADRPTSQAPSGDVGGVPSSVPVEGLIRGGPTRDGIPAIDNPTFITVQKADRFLRNRDVGIAFSQDGVDRFYPFQILVWHEIVNDTINGQRVLVTYCPLCMSGLVFDPVVDGEQVEFGVSGLLWNSNLVMYDRKTESLWSQIRGEAIVGPQTGSKLEQLPSEVMNWEAWKQAHPSGEVLSRNTGHPRQYGTDPYGDYYTTAGVLFPLTHSDERYPEKALVVGVMRNGEAKAYPVATIEEQGELSDTVGGQMVVLRHDSEDGAIRAFQATEGAQERIPATQAFWFAWSAMYPETDLYQP